MTMPGYWSDATPSCCRKAGFALLARSCSCNDGNHSRQRLQATACRRPNHAATAQVRLTAGLQFAILCLLQAALLGCVSSAPRTATTDQSVRDGVAAVLNALQRNLPGRYNNHLQVREHADSQPPPAHLRLDIEAQTDTGRFLVTQSDVTGKLPQRTYIWQFGASEDGRLLMEFAPQIDGQTGRACRLELLPAGAAISGSTQAEQCLLPNKEGLQLGLLKEYLLLPEQIDIGERLVDLQQQTTVGTDRKLRFRREQVYAGWAGRKLDSDAEWQLAKPFQLHNQGDVVLLLDQLDRPLGYHVELAQVRYRADQPEILRLALIDSHSEQQIAFAFADSNASQIGLHLGWLQIGLQRVEPAPQTQR